MSTAILSKRAAKAYRDAEAKEVLSIGAQRFVDPITGAATMRPFVRGMGASNEPYPMDPTYDESLRREAKRRARFRYEHGASLATVVAVEATMESDLRQRGWQPNE